jgi:hypothetical protein
VGVCLGRLTESWALIRYRESGSVLAKEVAMAFPTGQAGIAGALESVSLVEMPPEVVGF